MKKSLISLFTIFCSFLLVYFSLSFFFSKENKVTSREDYKQEIVTEDFDDVKEETNIVATDDTNAIDFSSTLADYDTWKAYHQENIDLSTDFIGIDINNSEITKKEFISALTTGSYAAIKLYDAEYMYKLYEINKNADEKISKAIKSSSNVIYNYLLKEGTRFPDFNVKDINGNVYTNKNIQGNILVIDCWFLQCTQCIKEIPKLNDLYDRYESYEDIMFLSLIFDKTEKVKKFLSRKEFRYPVVTDQKEFIQNDVGAIQYPTHLIVDQYGDIKKMVNNVDSLILALDTMINGDLIPENDI